MNTTNKILIIVIAIIIVIGGVYLASRTKSVNEQSSTSETLERNQDVAKGTVYFSVTDAAADMGNVSEVNMKISKVEMNNNASGWTTVSNTPKTYSLLDLNKKNQSKLFAEMQTKAGTYNQIRITIESVDVKNTSGTVKRAKLPSSEFLVNTTLMVNPEKTSSVNFDFLADKSLHTTANNEYVFTPVVKTETKSDVGVTVDSNNVVSVNGGNTDSSKTEGMDLDGTVKLNFQVDTKKSINLNTNGTIKLE